MLPGLAALPAVAALGWIGFSHLFVPHRLRLPPALPGDQRDMDSIAGRLSYYTAAPEIAVPGLPPLLLIHSVNAAASAYEMRPLYEAARTQRPVYALDLPGFGFSERSQRHYSPRLMTDAIHAISEEIRRIHGPQPIDALALSLSAEFLARAAVEAPDVFRSIGLISPTGLDAGGPYYGAPGSTRGNSALFVALAFPLWGRSVLDLLNTRASARFFLERAWGSHTTDEGLLDYDYLTAHQPGAEHAPLAFLGGFLFSKDITRVYESLRVPVFMAHGVRGYSSDVSAAQRVANRSTWTVRSFQTGALPHFEVAEEFGRAYGDFLKGLAPARVAAEVTSS